MNHIAPLKMLALGCIVLAAQEASAVTLDFEDIECAKTQELCGVGDLYMSRGYTLRYSPAPGEPYPVGFTAVGPSWAYNLNGSTALLTNTCGGTATLTADDNNPLTLETIDLAATNGDGPVSVEFIGRAGNGNGTKVSATFRLDAAPGWQRFRFPLAFRHLSSVSWAQGDCVNNKPHVFDNLSVSPTRTR